MKRSKLHQHLVAASITIAGQVYSSLTRYMSSTGLILSALPLEVEDKGALEKLPEAVRGQYKEKDGKYRLDVEGLEDVSGLKETVKTEREARKKIEREFKEKLKNYEGIDPDKVRDLMSHFDNAEEAELLRQGAQGIDKIVEKRMSKEREKYERQIEELKEQMEGSLEVAGTFMDRVVHQSLTEAAMRAGIHQHAIDDVLSRGSLIFSADDEGNAVQFEEDGENVVFGKDGKTPYSPAEWIEEMKEKAPHWWPAGNSGSGANGSNRRPGGGGAKAIKRSDWEQLDGFTKAQKMKEGFTIQD